MADDFDDNGISLGGSIYLGNSGLVDLNGNTVDTQFSGVGSTTGVLIDGGSAVTAVPTLTEWAMILLALALGGLAVFKLQARHRLAA